MVPDEKAMIPVRTGLIPDEKAMIPVRTGLIPDVLDWFRTFWDDSGLLEWFRFWGVWVGVGITLARSTALLEADDQVAALDLGAGADEHLSDLARPFGVQRAFHLHRFET